MQMLNAGGIDVVFDESRPADQHNPHGYFEYEKVKSLAHNNTWITGCKGKAIKVLYHLLKFLPLNLNYKIIFMRRNLVDILDSQDKMLYDSGKPLQERERVISIFEKELFNIQKWLEEQRNMDTLFMDYNFVLKETYKSTGIIMHFLGNKLDILKMRSVIYRGQI